MGKSTIKAKSQKIDLSPDLQKAHEYIYTIDFSMIINKLIKRHKWLRIEAEEACQQYRNYLWLLRKYGATKKLAPSKKIDDFWHHHILDTNKYTNDCVNIFGNYIHHYPTYNFKDYKKIDSLKKYYSNTKKLYFLEFNEHLYSLKFYLKPLLRILKI